MRYRLVTFIVFGAALIGISLWDAETRELKFNQAFNHSWLEFCIGNSRDIIKDPSVTFVRMDEETRPFNNQGNSLTRLDYGTNLRILDNQKPRVVAFHSVPEFDENNQLNQAGSLQPLKTAAMALPLMTLGAIAEVGQAPAKPEENVIYRSIPAANITGDLTLIPNLTRTVRTPDAQMLVNGDPAFTELALAPPGRRPFRWVPLVARQGDKVIPSFTVAALLNQIGRGLSAVYLQLPPTVKKPTLIIGNSIEEPVYQIPIDQAGRMKVYEDNGLVFDFSDGTDATRMLTEDEQFSLKEAVRAGRIPHVNTYELNFTGADDAEFVNSLLRTEETERLRRGLESMNQFLILVGDDRIADQHIELPLSGKPLSPAGLTVHSIATIQSGRYIQQWPIWLVGTSVIVILSLGIWLFGKRPSRVFILGGVCLLFYLSASVALFKYTLLWTPPLLPTGLFALIVVVGLILPYEPEPSKPD